MKKFKFRLDVVLEMREHELEQRRMEMAKIVTALNSQQQKLQDIIISQRKNSENANKLLDSDFFDIQQAESHRVYGLKLLQDAQNQQRVIDNTKSILKVKQGEVQRAHQKVEVLKKLKEKEEKEYYKELLDAEVKEIDDMTSARFKRK